ncbi:hypothetical protein FRC10_006772 [Ceratobasidium sp. 414]|nr:hypothetical protein FRC10_006772 [Ceratobasidium sp. 414]
MLSQQTNAASNRAALAQLQDLSAWVDQQDAMIASTEAKNVAQDSMLAHHTEQIQALEKVKDLTNQFSHLTHTELDAQKKQMDYIESLICISYAAGNVVSPQGILDDADVDLITANAVIGGGDGDGIDLSACEHEIQKDLRLKLQNWVNYIVNYGATVTPTARDVLAHLTHKDITTACKLQFSYLPTKFCHKSVANVAAAAQPTTTHLKANRPNEQVGDQEPGGMPDNMIDPVLWGTNNSPATSLADVQSQAKGKCDIHTQKRNNLAGVDAGFQEAKYDSYFTPGAMSDDETAYENRDGMWVKTRALRKWEKISWAMWKWMIDGMVLEAHPKWTNSGLVIRNGVVWGDSAELMACLPAAKKRKVKEGANGGIGVAGTGPLTEQAHKAHHALHEAEQCAVEAHDGETMEDLMVLMG